LYAAVEFGCFAEGLAYVMTSEYVPEYVEVVPATRTGSGVNAAVGGEVEEVPLHAATPAAVAAAARMKAEVRMRFIAVQCTANVAHFRGRLH
jgi:hypothetical protein